MAEVEAIGGSTPSRGRWFQSARESGSVEAAREAAPVADKTESSPARPSLGRLLVQAGVASEQQVKFAIAEGLETGEKLGEVLVRRGWATEELLAKLLAEQWQLPFSTGAALSVDSSAAKLLPPADARELGFLPIGFEGHRVLVAITEPTPDLLAAVATRFKEPSCIVVTRSDLVSLLGELSPDGATAYDAEPTEADGTEVDAAGESAISARADTDSANPGDSLQSFDPPPSVGPDTVAGSTLRSLEAAMGELQRIHLEVAALGKALEVAHERLAKAGAELQAVGEARERDAATIHRLESERSRQADLFETVRAQAARLNDTLAAHSAS